MRRRAEAERHEEQANANGCRKGDVTPIPMSDPPHPGYLRTRSCCLVTPPRLARQRTRLDFAWRDRTLLLLALVVGPCGVAALGAAFFAVTGHLALHHSGNVHLAIVGLIASYPFTFLVVFSFVPGVQVSGAITFAPDLLADAAAQRRSYPLAQARNRRQGSEPRLLAPTRPPDLRHARRPALLDRRASPARASAASVSTLARRLSAIGAPSLRPPALRLRGRWDP